MPTIVKCWLIGTMLAVLAAAGLEKEFKVIFDGNSGTGWILCDKKPVPKDHVQSDGLNPHGTGSYLVVHETQYGDFALDFDYKLSKGCNSGVFLRVGDLKDPVMTGIEIALDDTTGTDMYAPGAFYDLVAPKENAQKPAGGSNSAEAVKTATPIKHVIILIGENRGLDHTFGVYKPKGQGQTISNLLSKGIVNEDGTPGPNFAQAQQFAVAAQTSYYIGAPAISKSAYNPANIMPQPNTNGAPVAQSDILDRVCRRTRPGSAPSIRTNVASHRRVGRHSFA